jgi:hypothetical protein
MHGPSTDKPPPPPAAAAAAAAAAIPQGQVKSSADRPVADKPAASDSSAAGTYRAANAVAVDSSAFSTLSEEAAGTLTEDKQELAVMLQAQLPAALDGSVVQPPQAAESKASSAHNKASSARASKPSSAAGIVLPATQGVAALRLVQTVHPLLLLLPAALCVHGWQHANFSSSSSSSS